MNENRKNISFYLSNPTASAQEKHLFAKSWDNTAGEETAGGKLVWQAATESNDSSSTWFFIQEIFPETAMEVEQLTIHARYDSETEGTDDRWSAEIYSFEGTTLADQTFGQANLQLLAKSHETSTIPAGDFTFTFDKTRLEKGGAYCIVIRSILVEPLNGFYKNTGKTRVNLRLFKEKPSTGKLIKTTSTGFYEVVYPDGKSWLKSLTYNEITETPSDPTPEELSGDDDYRDFQMELLGGDCYRTEKIRIVVVSGSASEIAANHITLVRKGIEGTGETVPVAQPLKNLGAENFGQVIEIPTDFNIDQQTELKLKLPPNTHIGLILEFSGSCAETCKKVEKSDAEHKTCEKTPSETEKSWRAPPHKQKNCCTWRLCAAALFFLLSLTNERMTE